MFNRWQVVIVCSVAAAAFLATTILLTVPLLRADNPGDWPMVGRDPEHTGYGQGQPAPAFPLSVRWSYQTAGYPTSVVVASGTVYAGSINTWHALDAWSGGLKWTYIAPSGAGAPAVVGSTLYANAGDGKVYALDANSGSLKWTYQREGGRNITPVTVMNGVVYAAAGDSSTGPGSLSAIFADTGILKWRYSVTANAVTTAPAVSQGMVYFGDSGGKFYAVDAAAGTISWTYQTSGEARTSPAVAGGLVYIGSNSGIVHALDASTGALRWSFAVQGQGVSSPAVAGGIVYVGASNKLYALAAGDGSPQWQFTAVGGIGGPPAVAGGVVYFNSAGSIGSLAPGKFYALSATNGSLKWSYSTFYQGGGAPAYYEGVVYASASTGRIYAFGQRGWQYKSAMPTGRAFGAQGVVNNVIYTIGGLDASFYGRKVEAYDPASDTWRAKTSMSRSDGRYELCAVAIGGYVYTVGGLNISGRSASSSADRYDPHALFLFPPWRQDVATYPKPVFGAACVEYQGKGYFFGGSSIGGTLYRDNSEFSAAAGSFSEKHPMPTGRVDAFAAVVGNKAYVIGGWAGPASSPLQKTEVYDF